MLLRLASLLLLFALPVSAQAWWGGYGPAYPGSYWSYPGTGYGYAPYGQNWGYGGSDWNVKGFMNEWGDTHFVIEYHGNVYDDMTGGGWGRRSHGYPGGFPGYGSYGLPYPASPYPGGWR